MITITRDDAVAAACMDFDMPDRTSAERCK
jgi:hypothetical protein